MLTQKVGGVPVVDQRENVVGVITESDIFRMLIAQWERLEAPKVT